MTSSSHQGEDYLRPSLSHEAFGEKLRRLRTGVGLSIPRLAQQAGVTRQAIWKWETGHARPVFESLQYLANALNVSVSELIDKSDLVEAYAVDGRFFDYSPAALSWLPISTFFERQPATKNVVLWADGPCCGFFDQESQKWRRCGIDDNEEPVDPTHWQPFPRGPIGA